MLWTSLLSVKFAREFPIAIGSIMKIGVIGSFSFILTACSTDSIVRPTIQEKNRTLERQSYVNVQKREKAKVHLL